MPQFFSRTVLSVIVLLLMYSVGQAQHFFFIEADGQRPFYARVGEKTHSSSASGFMIIPNITEASLELVIGFSDNSGPENKFIVRHNGQDRGFQLKLFEAKGWGLFDLTTMEVTLALAVDSKALATNAAKKPSTFGALLSAATNDPGLILKATSATLDAAAPDKPGDSAPRPQATLMQVTNRKSIATLSDSSRPDGVTKIAHETDQQLTRMVFIDRSSTGKADTIDVQVERPVAYSASGVQTTGGVEADQVARDNPAASVAAGVNKKMVSACNRPTIPEKELRSIQKKVLGIASEKDQADYIEKVLRSKCITSQQAMEMGSYFSSESQRLVLYQKIYSHLSDPENFVSAIMQFSEKANQASIKQLIGVEQ